MPRNRSAPLLIALVLSLVLGLVAPAGAQSDPAAERERIRAERARKAQELDGLKVSDEQLAEAVAALDAHIATQQSRLEAARQAAGAAEAEQARARAAQEEIQGRIDAIRAAIVEFAIETYVDPRSSGQEHFITVVQTADFGEAVRKWALLSQVADNDRRLLDELDEATQELEQQQEVARQAAARAEASRTEAQGRLAELDRSRQEAAEKRRQLDVRRTEVLAEIDAHAQDEQRLTELILERQRAAEAAARAEAERRAAAARAAAEAERRAAEARTAAERRAAEQRAAEQRRVSERQSSPAPQSAQPAPGGGGNDAPAPSGARMVWPTRGVVTSEYGQRWGRLHAGIDIGAGTGTTIVAAASGVVIHSGWMGGYGNTVVIDHGGGLTTVYAHQSRIASSNGSRVSQGQVIGYVGNTGNSTGPHLHFETRVNGQPRNPRNYLP